MKYDDISILFQRKKTVGFFTIDCKFLFHCSINILFSIIKKVVYNAKRATHVIFYKACVVQISLKMCYL